MMRLPLFALALAATVSSIVWGAHAQQAAVAPREGSDQPVSAMKIRIKLQEKVITATLADNPTSRDFVSLLPLDLTLEDYAATEKISYLPRKLTTEGAPAGSEPAIGDISYYAPWGNLAVFYRDFRFSSGLIKLGKIDSGAEGLNVPGRVKVTIELLSEKPQ
jgi:hypothetical protein